MVDLCLFGNASPSSSVTFTILYVTYTKRIHDSGEHSPAPGTSLVGSVNKCKIKSVVRSLCLLYFMVRTYIVSFVYCSLTALVLY
jgi:hypothetical protein